MLSLRVQTVTRDALRELLIVLGFYVVLVVGIVLVLALE